MTLFEESFFFHITLITLLSLFLSYLICTAFIATSDDIFSIFQILLYDPSNYVYLRLTLAAAPPLCHGQRAIHSSPAASYRIAVSEEIERECVRERGRTHIEGSIELKRK
jgi:hypothetical protein